MSRRLIKSTKRSLTESTLEEVRRYGWLHDYHMELDQGPDRSISVDPVAAYQPSPRPTQQVSAQPVVINVNINLGDMLRRIVAGESTATEALEEMVQSESSQQLTEGVQDFKKGDRVRHKPGHVHYGTAKRGSKGEGVVVVTPRPWDREVVVKWDGRTENDGVEPLELEKI